MRYHLLAAVAAFAIATPAAARDGSPYIGIEGGLLDVQTAHYNNQGIDGSLDSHVAIHHNLGIDADVIAGYDFGFIRAEAELGYKHAGIDHTTVENQLIDLGPSDSGRARSVSAMGNVMADFGSDTGVSGYVGAGVGVARTSYSIHSLGFHGSDSNLAWQIIAGVRFPISANIDAGIKYRYFDSKYDIEQARPVEVLGRWRSHSLLASLIYNFGGVVAAPPPPPPPPPPP